MKEIHKNYEGCYKKGQEWWEISCNPDPKQALAEELNEILEEARWYKKLAFEVGGQRGINYDSSEDIRNFWKKWSDGGHFWHSQKKRWYVEKWWISEAGRQEKE